jgi:hypothetical protein
MTYGDRRRKETIMAETTPEQPERDRERAGDLTGKVCDTSTEHSGNRATADEDAPQPTRESTRDRRH